jgi:hypothetical protein
VRTAPKPPEPDTLQVRLFDDAADEEIALERGELDAAVFWPGEASNHIRESMRWGGSPTPLRRRGVVGATATSLGAADALAEGRIPRQAEEDLARLNAELFRGDLQPTRYARSDSVSRTWSFDIDFKLPGRQSILRVLGHAHKGPTESVILTFFDELIEGPPSSETHADPILWLYLFGCPVLSRPELRPYLDSINLSAIVNLFDCETASRRP